MDDTDLPYFHADVPLFRIARKPNPWQPADWAYCQDDLTFGNRFDDSNGTFRVLYASSSRLGSFIETLWRFRRAPENSKLELHLAEISNAGEDHVPLAHVPASWLSKRLLGSAVCAKARFADVYSSKWLAYLRKKYEGGYFRHNAREGEDFDLAVLMSQQRKLTQEISALVYQLGYDGIRYPSRHGTDLMNWALFEPFELSDLKQSELTVGDADFIEALYRLNLGLSLSL